MVWRPPETHVSSGRPTADQDLVADGAVMVQPWLSRKLRARTWKSACGIARPTSNWLLGAMTIDLPLLWKAAELTFWPSKVSPWQVVTLPLWRIAASDSWAGRPSPLMTGTDFMLPIWVRLPRLRCCIGTSPWKGTISARRNCRNKIDPRGSSRDTSTQ